MPAPKVTVATPLVQQVVEWDRYTGRLAAIDEVEVRARVTGYLKSVNFDEGADVERGQLLFVIDPRPFEAELTQAEAALKEAEAKVEESQSKIKAANAGVADAEARLELANRQYRRISELKARNAATQNEAEISEAEQLQATASVESAKAEVSAANAGLATSEAAVKTAQAAVEAAKLNLSYTKIVAPIAGRTSRHFVTEGNLIDGGTGQATLLTTIVSLDPIHCYFDANEQAFLKYVRLTDERRRQSSRQVKNPVYLQLADEKGYPHVGHTDFVDNRIDKNTGTIRARAIFPNDSADLTPGLFARLRVPGRAPFEAVLIPDRAIGTDQSDRFVNVLQKDNTVKRHPIEIGSYIHGLRVVSDGLEGDERIVIDGLQLLRPGVPVDPQPGKIEITEDDGLPNTYEPVPEEKWLTKKSKEAFLTDDDPPPSSDDSATNE
ncbi:efflux RND transporter periplasmic adaptor subunit [Thalassoroseus pseudoceratinae]|uniref:efflux RND transporter periplasmic adaptor subunit n=1 Tax=Thalassoroseus pseudoceratinae TaxID=2713176 RepID=UPI00197EF5F4|nr:efflux RND transporter periplasmic adaptor subunit [Thalassoroseus pseudoceratinae]